LIASVSVDEPAPAARVASSSIAREAGARSRVRLPVRRRVRTSAAAERTGRSWVSAKRASWIVGATGEGVAPIEDQRSATVAPGDPGSIEVPIRIDAPRKRPASVASRAEGTGCAGTNRVRIPALEAAATDGCMTGVRSMTIPCAERRGAISWIVAGVCAAGSARTTRSLEAGSIPSTTASTAFTSSAAARAAGSAS
jgi:hypothetical protein